jgi:LCP family protein required for cell wall assembly
MYSYSQVRRAHTIKLLLIILGVLITMVIGCGIFLWVNVSKISDDLGFDQAEILPEEVMTESEEIENLPEISFVPYTPSSKIEKFDGTFDLLLIGVDNRHSGKFTGRSDVTMYLRIDSKNNKIKLVSFMRDTLVSIKDHGTNRLNTPYNFGSFELLNNTMSNNFGVSAENYVVINFYGMEDIIDELGGVNIDVKSNEIENMNKYIDELNKLDDSGYSEYIRDAGEQKLNGRQAVAYMRVRKIGGDAMRIQRQQNVLNAMFSKIDDISLTRIPGLINTMGRYVRTSISIKEMIEIARIVKSIGAEGIEKYRFPADYKYGNYDGRSVVVPKDTQTEIEKLHEFIIK